MGGAQTLDNLVDDYMFFLWPLPKMDHFYEQLFMLAQVKRNSLTSFDTTPTKETTKVFYAQPVRIFFDENICFVPSVFYQHLLMSYNNTYMF